MTSFSRGSKLKAVCLTYGIMSLPEPKFGLAKAKGYFRPGKVAQSSNPEAPGITVLRDSWCHRRVDWASMGQCHPKSPKSPKSPKDLGAMSGGTILSVICNGQQNIRWPSQQAIRSISKFVWNSLSLHWCYCWVDAPGIRPCYPDMARITSPL